VADRGWGRPFDDPIEVDGRKLVMPRDLGRLQSIAEVDGKPSIAEDDARDWQLEKSLHRFCTASTSKADHCVRFSAPRSCAPLSRPQRMTA
jgi:hypothetical protein